MKKTIFESDHPQLHQLAYSLAKVYILQQRYAEAETVLQEYYPRSKEVTSYLDFGILTQVASLYCSMQKYENAKILFQRGVEYCDSYISAEQLTWQTFQLEYIDFLIKNAVSDRFVSIVPKSSDINTFLCSL